MGSLTSQSEKALKELGGIKDTSSLEMSEEKMKRI